MWIGHVSKATSGWLPQMEQQHFDAIADVIEWSNLSSGM